MPRRNGAPRYRGTNTVDEERWLVTVDFAYCWKILGRLAPTIPYTLMIIGVSGAFGLLLAMVVAAVRIRRWPVFYPLTNLYLSFFRSTPSMIHIFLIYYGLPLLVRQFGLNIDGWDRTLYALAALVLFNGAYMSEFLRPAYLSVDRGQHDAADSIGMGGFSKFRRIILPQMLPVAWPNLENAMVELVKDTSVLFVIGLTDIMGKAKNIIANDYGVNKLEVYLVAAAVYWLMTYLVGRGFHLLGRRLGVAKYMRR